MTKAYIFICCSLVKEIKQIQKLKVDGRGSSFKNVLDFLWLWLVCGNSVYKSQVGSHSHKVEKYRASMNGSKNLAGFIQSENIQKAILLKLFYYKGCGMNLKVNIFLKNSDFLIDFLDK
jgi:hypothetical protein